MSERIISFDELQNWDCAENEFGGIYNDGNGCNHILRKTYSYPSEWDTDNKKQKYNYTKEELQEIWDSYIKEENKKMDSDDKKKNLDSINFN